MLDMAAVQAVVDSNPDIAPIKARAYEQIIVGNMFAVALSNFTMVVATNNPSDVLKGPSRTQRRRWNNTDGRYDGEIPQRREKPSEWYDSKWMSSQTEVDDNTAVDTGYVSSFDLYTTVLSGYASLAARADRYDSRKRWDGNPAIGQGARLCKSRDE
jgi:hypothetical protein